MKDNCGNCPDGYLELHRKPPCDECEADMDPPMELPLDMAPKRLDVKAPRERAPEHFREYYLSQENPDATDEEIDREWAIVVRDLQWYDIELAKEAEAKLLEAGHKNSLRRN